MRIGVMVPIAASDGADGMPSWSDIRGFVQYAEELGLDSVWVCDHLLSGGPGQEPEGIHEAWTILSALAATTTRIELGQLVMCASFRHPALLAKMAVTADAVSGGRITLGIGAGWYDVEYEAFGFPTDHRASRFSEALAIISPLLRGERVTLDGRYHQLRDAVLLPPPARRVPLLVAGRRPRMLQLTAQYADAWNTAWYGLPDDRLRQQLDDLDAALDAEGRDPATLRRTVGVIVGDPAAANPDPDALFRGSVDELAGALDAYAKLAVDDVLVLPLPMNARALDRLAEAQRLRG
jgi:alkanesulfonate monooxygenase SsuD/methylene tetrahydromethanopterin reductase-like flavin-dependent oxidoreductase (luciferase family)